MPSLSYGIQMHLDILEQFNFKLEALCTRNLEKTMQITIMHTLLVHVQILLISLCLKSKNVEFFVVLFTWRMARNTSGVVPLTTGSTRCIGIRMHLHIGLAIPWVFSRMHLSFVHIGLMTQMHRN